MTEWKSESSGGGSLPNDKIVFAQMSKGQPADLEFPLDFVRDKSFFTGMTGSGKSWSAGLMMEEINRVGLQFVCFDVLGAHDGLATLNNVEALSPKNGETVNMRGLVERLGKEPTSFVIDISGLPLDKQQVLLSDYCEALISAQLNKGILTVFEECQDFVPQQGKPISSEGIIRLCKLGRQYGYGVCLISQRPASVSKDALSQCSVYMIHNLVNHRDLKAVEDQMGFGADRTQVKKLSAGIASATQGEVVCYSPSYFRDEGFFRASKIREDRKVTHSGSNIELKPATFSSQNTDFSKNPSMDIGSMPTWASESVTSVNFDTNSATQTPELPALEEKEAKMDSLSKLSSATLKEDFPELQYVAPDETLKIELDAPKLELSNETQQSNPFMGIGIVLGVAGFSYLTLSTILK
jgi:hypothetical protein